MKWFSQSLAFIKRVTHPIGKFLDKLVPQSRDMREALAGVAMPIFVLVVGRIWLFTLAKKATAYDLWAILLGEMQIWLSAALIAACALRLISSAYRIWIRIALAVFAVFYGLVTVVDTSLFAMIGSRIDPENLEVFTEEFWLIWPVVSSEMSIWHWLICLLIVMGTVFPLRIRFADRKSLVAARGVFLSLLPIFAVSYQYTKSPVKELRPLDRDLIGLFYWDSYHKKRQKIIAPDPETLVPLAVEREASTPPPNVVLIILESTGLHQTTVGNPRVKSTPNLKALAQNGLYSKNMTTVMPHTTKAILSIVCGDWPQLERRAKEALPGGLPGRCLPHLMRDLGYRTAFMQTAKESFEERKEMIKGMGYEVFRSRETLDRENFEESNYFGLDDLALVEPGLAWSSSDYQTPFFMTYLTLTSHHKYTLPKHAKPAKKIRSRRKRHLATIEYVDSVVGKIIDGYKRLGLYDNTIFILVGDHGEGMGEHGRWIHDQVIWDEGLKVPFVIHAPKLISKKGRIKGVRQQMDILPTVIELIGAKITEGKPRGLSLMSSVPTDRVVYHSCLKQHSCMARRQGKMKFIDHFDERPVELFDLTRDARERRNLASTKEESTLEAYRQELQDWKAQVHGHYQAQFERWSDPDLQEIDNRSPLAVWNDQMSLLSCSLQRMHVLPADTAWLHCDWRSEDIVGNWKMQMTLIDSNGKSFKSTWFPRGGRFPPFRWKPNTRVSDEIPIEIPEDVALGSAQIHIGWQNYSGSARFMADGDALYHVADVLIGTPIKDGGDW